MTELGTTKIFHDADADPAALAGKTVAVVGYGNQGRSQALNLRDSGVSTIVGSIDDERAAQARDEQFAVYPIAEACNLADVIMLLVPDEIMPAIYEESVQPNLASGNVISFASGYNVAFDLIVPPADVDVIMIAPRMIGPGVRDSFVDGRGFPSFVALHQDATGSAMACLLALAHALGSTRAGCILMSMHDEASLDLFNEQAVGPALARTFLSAIETLVDAGYPPEAVLLELYLSGEIGYTFEKIREVGMMRQMDFHSRTSQYGTLTRTARFADIDLEQRMNTILGEIQDGTFTREWSGADSDAAEMLTALKEARDSMPLNDWEGRTRREFRIGDAVAHT